MHDRTVRHRRAETHTMCKGALELAWLRLRSRHRAQWRGGALPPQSVTSELHDQPEQKVPRTTTTATRPHKSLPSAA
jgi:hypothetical protein